MSSPTNLGHYRQARDSTSKGPRPRASAVLEAFDKLRTLHTPVLVCRGCCSLDCSGSCHWADAYGGELLTVCAHCCIDPEVRKQSYPCLDYHVHGEEHDERQVCATNAILDLIPKSTGGA